MAPKSPLNVILGAANIGIKSADATVRFETPEEINSVLDLFYERGYRTLDTARGYSPLSGGGTSEERLGAVEAGKRFTIDTKVYSREPGSHKKELIERDINDSLAALKVSQVDVEYLHAPDRATPFEETCEALDKAFREGKFKRFGLSNYAAEEVEKIVKICEERGFVKPSVYQGQYNPVVRSGEKELFPVLRKHGIAFYAWSPAAGGYFAGAAQNARPGGRFDKSHRLGQMFGGLYDKPAIEAATQRALKAAEAQGISGHAAALRWTVYHSVLDDKYGDAVIIAGSSPEQLTANLDMIEAGPLPQAVADAFGGLFKETAGSEVPYHF